VFTFHYNQHDFSEIDGNTTIVVDNLTEATALDIHYERGLVCWSDIDQGKIQCSSFKNASGSRKSLYGQGKRSSEKVITQMMYNFSIW